MSAITRTTGGQGCRRWSPGIAALAVALGSGVFAQVVSVPAAHLNHAEGSVAYAPQGDQEWHDVQPRRLLKRGDRLWTDRGSRAEVQAGGHALRMNGETQLILENVSDTATQLSLTQGSIAATVTRVNPGDSFEVGTPNLAFRARQPGDYRIDVDTKQGVTRVVVLAGTGVVYGEKGEALELRTGQRLTFRDRNLARMLQPAFAASDDFDRWAGARKRGEPTVSMPTVAAAPDKPIPNTISKGKDIVISGSAASLKQPPAQAKAAAPVAPAIAQPAVLAQPAAKVMPSSPPTLKVAAPMLPPAASVQNASLPAAPAPQAQAAAARAQADAQAQAQAQAAREQQRLAQQRTERERQAAARAEQERQAAAAARAEQDRRALVAAEARRADERRRALAARHAEEERRQLAARREQEHRRHLAMKRAEEEKQKKLALARRAAEEKRLAAARKAEQQKLAAAEAARRQHLARLQEQARREEQSSVVRRAEAARRADEDRREELARRAEQARREEDARREEQARRDDVERRQRALAEQARRDQARREEEVWLRQQQQIYQPSRPQPMGVPARRIS
ncbi:hypothetical protein [Ramlibacter sp. AN1133]|uniref:hypothetical protein n=1 Tax=Ramlibacter sp. AN1133 TaxID=3133429 RepID=UPI0030BAC5EC